MKFKQALKLICNLQTYNNSIMKMFRTFLCLLLTFAFVTANAQKKSLTSKKAGYTTAEADTMEIADYLFDQKDYELALPYYKKLFETHSEDLALTYRMGVCYLNKSDEHGKAIDCFIQIMDKDRKAYDISYYLGKAYFLNHQYDQALDYFNQYMASKKATDDKKKEIKRLIENCSNGKKLMENPLDVKIENVDAPVNTEASEYGPVISSDESVLIYTYHGSRSTGGKQNIYNQPDPYGIYFEDVFMSERINGKWSEPQSIGDNINGVGHDACIALSSDGQKLFVYKNTSKDMGDIYMSRLQGKEWQYPEKLKGDINKPDSWEGSISISADEKTVYFASEKKGGLGGRDLYRAVLQSDGTWGDVTGLGGVINTVYDDDAPFIHPDGTQLYYSSKGHNSMGGYDIFRVDIQADGTLSEPVNLGYPINTADDDRFYVLTADGKKAYYSSGKAGGNGKQDIYVVDLGIIGKKTILILLKGQVTLNDQPAESEIIVTNAENDQNQGDYKSNGASGKYLINLPAGAKYKVTYKMPGFDDQVQILDAKGLGEFDEKNIDIQFYNKSEFYLVDSAGNILQTGEQIGYSSFVFETLPPDNNCFFKIIPENDTTLTKNLKIFVKGSNKPKYIVKNSTDKFFRLQLLAADNNALTKTEEENTTLKIMPETEVVKADTATVKAEEIPAIKPLPQTYEDYLVQYGNASIPGLEFWVQIAAFRLPENYNYKKMEGLGKIEKKENTGDGLTRFVIGGNFKTLANADSHKNKIVAKGTKDAFVYATYEGKRVSLKELIQKNLFQNK